MEGLSPHLFVGNNQLSFLDPMGLDMQPWNGSMGDFWQWFYHAERGPAFATVGLLVSDDTTGVGIADDIAIPVVMAAALTYDLTERTYVT